MSDQKTTKSSRKRRINRSQRKAVQVRTSATTAAEQAAAAASAGSTSAGTTTRRNPRGRSIEALISRPVELPRAVEYTYIRSDLRRLAYTAIPLLVMMIGLLFVID